MKTLNSFFSTAFLLVSIILCICACSSSHFENDKKTDEDSDIFQNDNTFEDSEDISDEDSDEDSDETEDEDPDTEEITEPVMLSQKDMNPYYIGGFYPQNFTELTDGIVVFSGSAANGSRELWRTDGTAEGTSIIKDISPGSRSSNPRDFVKAGDIIFFTANLPEQMDILFRTDGTTEGTVPVKTEEGSLITEKLIKSSNFYQTYYNPEYHINTAVGSEIFFFITDSSENKRLVSVSKESNIARTLRTFPGALAVTGRSGESIFFIATDESDQWKLWKYNITEETFSQIYDFECKNCGINVTYTYQFSEQFIFGLTLGSSKRIYLSDGTENGTISIAGDNSSIREIDSSPDVAYILLYDSSFISTDGTEENTFTFETGIDIEPEFYPYSGIMSFKIIEDKYLLLYTLKNFIEDDSRYSFPRLTTFDMEENALDLFHSFESLRDDVTERKPVVIKYDNEWYMIEGEVDKEYPTYGFSTYHDYLYKVDFRKGSKTKINSIVNYAYTNFRDYVEGVSVQAGKIWMSGQIVQSFHGDFDYLTGYELIVSDGTEEGTGMIKHIGLNGAFSYSRFYPVAHESHLFFNEPVDILRERIMHTDLSVGKVSDPVVLMYRLGYSKQKIFYNDRLFMNIYPEPGINASSSRYGSLNITDHSMATLHERYVSTRVALENGVLFLGTDNSYTSSLYVTDGTKDGTKIIKTENPDAERTSSDEMFHTLLTDGKIALFFYIGGSYADKDLNYQIWKTDGTESGTVKLLEGIDEKFSRAYRSIVCGKNFLMSSESYNDFEVYLSRGTSDSTFIVTDCGFTEDCTRIHPGCSGDAPLLIKEFGNGAKISIHKISSQGKLEEAFFEKSDAELKMYHEIFNTPGNKNFFFVIRTKSHGFELWKTDGTTDGTSMVKDINQGIESSYPAFLRYHGSYLYFNASNGTDGYELWKTDGTEKNTEMIIDLNPGPGSSSIKESVLVDKGIIVNGVGSNGLDQLWFIPFQLH